MIRRPPRSPLFPYPPLFRSVHRGGPPADRHAGGGAAGQHADLDVDSVGERHPDGVGGGRRPVEHGRAVDVVGGPDVVRGRRGRRQLGRRPGPRRPLSVPGRVDVPAPRCRRRPRLARWEVAGDGCGLEERVAEPGVRTLGGRYALRSLLATGGMGQVWRADDVLLDRPVAVKLLRSEYTGDPTFLARFRAEAHHTARLVHPNIAALHDYGEVVAAGGETCAYLVMELVEGEPLSALLTRCGRLDPQRTLDIVRQTAAALAVAHAAGVVHRDVKPGNVLVGWDGVVKITDFGIAWSASSVPLTRTGQVVGTAHYLSPEQAEGGKAGPASDVYALGAFTYECLAGRRAFDGESPVQIALAQIRDEPEPLPDDVPEPMRTLVARAMVKDPALRFPDGAAFRAAIDAVRAGRPLAPLPPTTARSEEHTSELQSR